MPVAEVLPRFVDGGAGEGRIAAEGFEEHTSERPVVDCEVVLFAFEDFGRHIVWRAYNRLGVVDLAFTEGAIAVSSFGNRALLCGVAKGCR